MEVCKCSVCMCLYGCHNFSALDGDKEECLCNLEHCIEEIRTWMATNYLKFNTGKTEFVVFGKNINFLKWMQTTCR